MLDGKMYEERKAAFAEAIKGFQQAHDAGHYTEALSYERASLIARTGGLLLDLLNEPRIVTLLAALDQPAATNALSAFDMSSLPDGIAEEWAAMKKEQAK